MAPAAAVNRRIAAAMQDFPVALRAEDSGPALGMDQFHIWNRGAGASLSRADDGALVICRRPGGLSPFVDPMQGDPTAARLVIGLLQPQLNGGAPTAMMRSATIPIRAKRITVSRPPRR